MSWLSFSTKFEYLCYGSTTITIILFISVRGRQTVFIHQNLTYRRQILTYKDGPRAKRVNVVLYNPYVAATHP